MGAAHGPDMVDGTSPAINHWLYGCECFVVTADYSVQHTFFGLFGGSAKWGIDHGDTLPGHIPGQRDGGGRVGNRGVDHNQPFAGASEEAVFATDHLFDKVTVWQANMNNSTVFRDFPGAFRLGRAHGYKAVDRGTVPVTLDP